jgi:hypothetical protein
MSRPNRYESGNVAGVPCLNPFINALSSNSLRPSGANQSHAHRALSLSRWASGYVTLAAAPEER